MSEQKLEKKLASKLSKMMEDDDDDQTHPFMTQCSSKGLEKTSLKH